MPAMDQVVKGLTLEVADQDQQDGLEGMLGRDAYRSVPVRYGRMWSSEFVELLDVKEAGWLMREAICTSAMAPRTGKIDMGLLNTGTGVGPEEDERGYEEETFEHPR